jgi:DNA phosphorothioation-dependent restriction protein DptH
LTVARALGAVLRDEIQPGEEDADEREPNLCFTLDLYHPTGSSPASGGFLSDVGRRRRSGGGVLDARDRWMTETSGRPGEIIIPRLRWARRDEETEPRPAHISLAFDIFEARLEARPIDKFNTEARPLHAFGLSKIMERRADLTGDPEWTVFAPHRLEGERAPENRVGTDRLLRLDAALARTTARFLGGEPTDWPVLVTRFPPASQRWIDRLHEHSDWVVTIDRNACLEYFDAPRRLPNVYERFVIDAVPERADLGALQLITSTSNLDEVRDLVDEALGDMGLSSSERNSRFLLTQLKALSGRLAIRLANPAGRTGEMIALALMQAHCAQPEDSSGAWLDLEQGFFVPVDEIVEVAAVSGPSESGDGADGNRRADFIHVRAGARGPLEFRFVEVKHRLHLKTARLPELLSSILRQTSDLHRRWHTYFFGDNLTPIERSLRRSQLARILRFYADRAARHRLSSQAYERLKREIDQLVLKEAYRPAEIDQADVGYIFCPEHRAGRPELLYTMGTGEARLWLFGPALLPEERAAAVEAPPPQPEIYETPLGVATSERRDVEPGKSQDSSDVGLSPKDAPSPTDHKLRLEGRVEGGQVAEKSTTADEPVDIVLGSLMRAWAA